MGCPSSLKVVVHACGRRKGFGAAEPAVRDAADLARFRDTVYRTDVESLTDAEVEGVRALGSELQAMCRELAASSEHTEALAEMPDARARIRTAYLAPWRRWAIAERWSAGRLERAFAPLFLRALLRIVAEETPLPGSA